MLMFNYELLDAFEMISDFTFIAAELVGVNFRQLLGLGGREFEEPSTFKLLETATQAIALHRNQKSLPNCGIAVVEWASPMLPICV